MFKPKATKDFKISDKYSVTLDNKHKEKMEEFSNIKKIQIPELIKKKKYFKKQLAKDGNTLENTIFYENNIININKKIKKLKLLENDYLLGNSKYIFNYFEKKKDISFEIYSDSEKMLEQIVDKYDLPDKSKALRCLLDYVEEKETDWDEMFATIRCNRCG